MNIYLNCTANLGDFLNAMPVLSGLSKNYQLNLIVRNETKKFRDFLEFLFFQNIFHDIDYDSNVTITNDYVFLSSWTRMDQTNPNRPIETCRYENWLRDRYTHFDFQVDDSFILAVPELEIDVFTDKFIVGDRWDSSSDPNVDQRRYSNIIRDHANVDFEKLVFLDYSESIFKNAAMIKQNPNKFITTFTGVGILADLMNKQTDVCWYEDMRNWDNNTVDFDWLRHYYTNRKSKLVYIKELSL